MLVWMQHSNPANLMFALPAADALGLSTGAYKAVALFCIWAVAQGFSYLLSYVVEAAVTTGLSRIAATFGRKAKTA